MKYRKLLIACAMLWAFSTATVVAITVSAGTDQKGFVGHAIQFHGTIKEQSAASSTAGTYTWNFGDATVGTGQEVSHMYQFPGDYVATLAVSFLGKTYVDHQNVSVVAPQLSFSDIKTGSNGYIELANLSTRDVDLSNWVISEEGYATTFTLPLYTTIKGGKSLTLANIDTRLLLGDPSVIISLRYPDRTIFLVSRTASTSETAFVPAPVSVVRTTPIPPITPTPQRQAPKSQDTPPSPVIISVATSGGAAVLWSAEGQQQKTYGPRIPFSNTLKWFFAFMGILLVGLAAFIVARSHIDKATIEDEYAIIEDIIEGSEDIVNSAQSK